MITDKLLSRNFILAKNKEKTGQMDKKYFSFHVYMKNCIKELFMTFLGLKLTPNPYKKIVYLCYKLLLQNLYPCDSYTGVIYL